MVPGVGGASSIPSGPGQRKAGRFGPGHRWRYNAPTSTQQRSMPSPIPPAELEALLHQVLPDAGVTPTSLPGLPERPPYWGFCRGSGLALARWILDNPERVRGRRVLDFGSGSGVVALACSAAGAQRSIACDLDPGAQLASAANAELNGLPLELA